MFYLDDHIWDFDLHAALAALNPQRREYAMRYRHERDQRLCVASFLLLKKALSIEYGLDDVPTWILDEKGKPHLEGFPDIHFNLSHCPEAVACAVGTSPVGIDVECCDRYDPEVAAATMSDEECARIAVSAYPDVEFSRLWTMKESLYKLTGDKNSDDLRSMLADTSRYRFHTTIYPRFICTVCTPNS